MFINFGRRKLRIKKYSDNHTACLECKSFGLNITIFKEYFHILFIPFFPSGIKTSTVYCPNCCRTIRYDSLQQTYEKATKNPVYLYSGLLLIGSLLVTLIYVNIQTQKEKKRLVLNPQSGDVYLVRSDDDRSTQYYFLRVTKIRQDSVFAFPSNFVYNRYVSRFGEDDFFVANEELVFSKSELLEMLDDGKINAVEREYDDQSGFTRVK